MGHPVENTCFERSTAAQSLPKLTSTQELAYNIYLLMGYPISTEKYQAQITGK